MDDTRYSGNSVLSAQLVEKYLYIYTYIESAEAKYGIIFKAFLV